MKTPNDVLNEWHFEYCNLQFKDGLFHVAEINDFNNNRNGWLSVAEEISKTMAISFLEYMYSKDEKLESISDAKNLFLSGLKLMIKYSSTSTCINVRDL